MKRLNTAMAALGLLALAYLILPFSGCSSEDSELEKKTEAFLKTDDYENALKLVEGFILEHPEKPIGRAMLVKVFSANGQIEKALKAYYQFYKLSETLSPKLLLEVVQGALNSDDSDVRQAAAHALGKLGDKSAIPALTNAFLNDDEYQVRWSAAHALGKLGDKSAIPTLINALNNDSDAVRYNTAFVLAKLGDSRAIPVLINALGNFDDDVQRNAVEALAKLGEQGLCTLIDALNNDNMLVGSAVVEALSKLDDSRVIPILINALDYFDDEARRNVVEALVRFGDQGFYALINALNDDKSWIRSRAAEALGELGDSRATLALINTLDDERDDVAAEALVKLGDSQTIPTLINTLNNNDSYQGAAHSLIKLVEALGERGDKCAIPMLIEVLGDANLDFCYPFEYPHKSLRTCFKSR